jgi:pyruvate/2-oxoglutarate dehydrogenase complex dihydrolipoamide acyltransferase (E2) component
MKDIIMPKKGQAMEEGTIAEWEKSEGDFVNENEVIASIETDKTIVPIEAPLSGYLHILTEEGISVPVGQIIAVIFETKEEYDKKIKNI